MKRNPIVRWRCLSLLPFCLAVSAQVTPANQTAPQGPVSYSSVNQLNSLLSQLEQASQSAQADLGKLRVERIPMDYRAVEHLFQSITHYWGLECAKPELEVA